MIKAVFFDIDGTLVSFKTHRVPQATLDALECLRRKNIKIFIATGRPIPYLKVVEHIPFDGYVTMNGSHCYTAQGEDIYKSPIPREDIARLVHWEGVHHIPFQFVSPHLFFSSCITPDSHAISQQLDVPIPPVMPVECALDKDIYQIIGFLREEQEESFFKTILTHSQPLRWSPLFADIIARGNSKDRGIDEVLHHYGMAIEECMAFGDGGNDIAMLRHAGIGVAMGNARDEVKAAADYVTSSVDEEGIPNALRHFEVI